MIRRSTWILLLVFAALLAGAFFWQRSQEEKAALEPTPTMPALILGLDTPQIRDIKIEDAQGKRAYFRRLGGSAWVMTEPERQNLEAQIMAVKLDQLTLMSPLSTLADPPSADQIGLEKPAYTITVTDEGGKDYVLEIGAETPTRSGYYIRLDGMIYVISQITIDELVDMLENPPVEVPTATATGALPAPEMITGTVTTPAMELPTSTP